MEIPTYEMLLDRMLSAIPDSIDKREGSLIYTAVAPVCAELVQMYLSLQGYYDLSFADTAVGEYLDRLCAQYGLTRTPASAAVWQAEAFDRKGESIRLPSGSRFFAGGVALVADENGDLISEEPGSQGNLLFGELVPAEYLNNFGSAHLGKLLQAGEDAESDEDLRKHFFNTMTTPAFGGNVADYREKAKAMSGIGGVKVFPAFDGGGTVKLVLLGEDLLPVEADFVREVKTAFDPEAGMGLGIAPIGHRVTVVSAAAVEVTVSAAVTLAESADSSKTSELIAEAVQEYFYSLQKTWEDTEQTVVRLSRVESAILSAEGVLDVENCTLNGSSSNLQLEPDALPVFGGFYEV